MKSLASFSRRAGWRRRPFKLAYPATHSTSEFDLLTRFVRIIDTQTHRRKTARRLHLQPGSSGLPCKRTHVLEMRDHIEAAERNESFGATGVAARPAAWSITATANAIASRRATSWEGPK
jgi:hypothetical protein